jgi:hypothetical protein
VIVASGGCNALAFARETHATRSVEHTPNERQRALELRHEVRLGYWPARGDEELVLLTTGQCVVLGSASKDWNAIDLDLELRVAGGGEMRGVGREPIRNVDRRGGSARGKPLRCANTRLGPGETRAQLLR